MGTKTNDIMRFAIIDNPKELHDAGKNKVNNFYQAGQKMREAWDTILSQEIKDNVSEDLFLIPFEATMSYSEEDRDRWLKDQYFDSAVTTIAISVKYKQYIQKHGFNLPVCLVIFRIEIKTYGFRTLDVVFDDKKMSIGNDCFFAYKKDYDKAKKYITEIKALMGLE